MDEIGEGSGSGKNLNVPLPHGITWSRYQSELLQVLARIADFQPEALVVSFGADTFEEDPISTFCLKTDDFSSMGQEIRDLEIPTVVVLEGGYAVDRLGVNVTRFLVGCQT